MPTYKTKDGIDRLLPGIGKTVDGQITTNVTIENPMFELVNTEAPTATPAASETSVAAPAAAPAVAPVNPTPTETTVKETE